MPISLAFFDTIPSEIRLTCLVPLYGNTHQTTWVHPEAFFLSTLGRKRQSELYLTASPLIRPVLTPFPTLDRFSTSHLSGKKKQNQTILVSYPFFLLLPTVIPTSYFLLAHKKVFSVYSKERWMWVNAVAAVTAASICVAKKRKGKYWKWHGDVHSPHDDKMNRKMAAKLAKEKKWKKKRRKFSAFSFLLSILWSAVQYVWISRWRWRRPRPRPKPSGEDENDKNDSWCERKRYLTLLFFQDFFFVLLCRFFASAFATSNQPGSQSVSQTNKHSVRQPSKLRDNVQL